MKLGSLGVYELGDRVQPPEPGMHFFVKYTTVGWGEVVESLKREIEETNVGSFTKADNEFMTLAFG